MFLIFLDHFTRLILEKAVCVVCRSTFKSSWWMQGKEAAMDAMPVGKIHKNPIVVAEVIPRLSQPWLNVLMDV